MDDQILSLLERCAVALEKIAEGGFAHSSSPSVMDSTANQTRKILMGRFDGLYITVDQARDALGMTDASSKAVGRVVAAAGFERRRWANGVKFAICEPGGICAGAPVVLPDNLEESAVALRIARDKYGKPATAQAVIYGAYIMQGKTVKQNQVTPQHIAEVKRLYPEFD